jgi:hypothetical protein
MPTGSRDPAARLITGFILFAALPAHACAPAPDAEAASPPAAAAPATGGPVFVAVPVRPAEWSRRAPLPERRTEVSATTDGRYIYLAGGFGPPTGDERATAPRALWRYDPSADDWTVVTRIPEGVHHAPFQYHDGRLYILGGFRETTFQPVANVRIYDLASGEWSEGAPMPTPRGASGWALLDGRIHVMGGNATADHDHAGERMTEDRSVNTHEAYDPAADRWIRLAPMPTPRNHLGAAVAGGRIHAVLGRADGDFTMTTHEIYDPATDRWSEGPPVPTGRSGVAVVERDGRIYAFGGERLDRPNQRTYDDAERFDPGTGQWERLPPLPTARHGLGAAVVGDAIYVISGGPEPAFSFGDAVERLEGGR